MTVCCGSRESPTGAYPGSCSESWSGSSSRSPASVARRSVRRFRSTKGASKARRDHINAEIRNMRGLLPIPAEDRERLSYLHSMSAICTFVRKSLFFSELRGRGGSGPAPPYELFLQALPGFMVVASREGRLLYVSENVSDFLGFSMVGGAGVSPASFRTVLRVSRFGKRSIRFPRVISRPQVDVLQGDTFYDMVDGADVELVKSNLEMDGAPSTERSFVCRMHTSKAFRLRHGPTCSVLVRGRFRSPPGSSSPRPAPERAFVALCTPTADRRHDGARRGSAEPFGTLHRADMSFGRAPHSVLFLLGYSPQEMTGRSWYSMVHPEDLHHVDAGEGALVEMVLRLQRKDLTWVWLYVRATKDSGKQEVSCMNYVIGETEAMFLRRRVHADDRGASTALLSQVPRLGVHGDAASGPLKRQGGAGGVSEEPRAERTCDSGSGSTYTAYADRACGAGQRVAPMSSAVLPATPPYSPASSRCPLTPEDGGSRFLLDARSYAETLLSPAESSDPFLLSHGTLPDPGFGFPDFTAPPFQSPGSRPSPSYELSAYPAASRLVPGCLQVPDAGDYSSDEAFHPDDFCLPDLPQGGDGPFLLLEEAPGVTLQAPGPPTPDPSPTGEGHFQYSERERTEISILARQISSLASSFDMLRSAELPLGPAAGHAKATPGGDLVPPCVWPQPASHPFRPELVPDEGLVDGVLRDAGSAPGRDAPDGLSPNPSALDDAPRVLDAAEGHSVSFLFALLEDVSLEQLLGAQPAPDSAPRTGRPRDSSELHQLGHYLHGSLRQDELVEEPAC
ncbi:neuronal PAS domain-containing protein 4-like isoform X2 [Scleropages formosus]|uniref:neuronal PAS domain-containing protein 4-like isoform X2 n=1 Tax=Scleropages formosus TaxID=113540 RepID=UPI0010FA83C5|nr:neuronal PAS domain-containing protein 4-like isoform X2 [Scleropages formosus]